jgi:hypothetical protein
MKHIILVASLLISFCAFASETKSPPWPRLPYKSWYISLAAPKHMEIWVEDVHVLDRRGLKFFHVFGGVPSYTGKVKGWHSGGGKSKPINNVDLPDRIYLRWQSLAEPKTYMINILIPQWVREVMLKREHLYCTFAAENMTVYRDTITLGMAPGGIVKVWVGDGCLGHLEVGRFEARIDPLGPHHDGNYIYSRPPSPKAQAYIEKYGIPYGSW